MKSANLSLQVWQPDWNEERGRRSTAGPAFPPAAQMHACIDALTGLRFFAALRVVLFHCVVGALFLQLHDAEFASVRRLLDRRQVRDRLVLASLAALAIMPVSVFLVFGRGPVATELVLFLLPTPIFALLVGNLAGGRTVLSRLPTHRWPLALGEASYALYITHAVLLTLFLHLFGKAGRLGLPEAAGCAAFTIMLSIGANRWIEAPARRALRPRRADIQQPPIGAAGDLRATA